MNRHVVRARMTLTLGLAVALLSSTSCGTGGNHEDGFVWTQPALGDTTGTILANGREAFGIFLSSGGFDLACGDSALDEVGAALVEFDLGTSVNFRPLTSARLRVYVNEVRGIPIVALGPVVARGLDLHGALDASDVSDPDLLGQQLPYLVLDERIGWHEVSVLNAVLIARDKGLQRVAFLLQPGILSEGPGREDSLRFDGVNHANPPQLVLTISGNQGP